MTISARMLFVAALSLDVLVTGGFTSTIPMLPSTLFSPGSAATAAAVSTRSFSSSQAPTSAPAASPQSAQRTLEVADYAELPVTGDKSTNLISGQLARGSILRDEPGGRRFFVNDLNGPLYILNKQTKQLTTYVP